MKKFISFLLITILCLTAITPTVTMAATKLSKNKATMEVDSTLKLKVTGTKNTVKWTTSNKSIATIEGGNITAMAEGQATITATVDKDKYSCIITVVDSGLDELTADKGTVTELTTGVYIIGEDFASGKYNIKTISGSGNFFVRGNNNSISEIMAEEGDAYFDTHTYSNLRLCYGDEMEICGGVILEFTKLN